MDKQTQNQIAIAAMVERFIGDLEAGGVDNDSVVTGLLNGCILNVARKRGAVGAATWLRRVADSTHDTAAAIDALVGVRN